MIEQREQITYREEETNHTALLSREEEARLLEWVAVGKTARPKMLRFITACLIPGSSLDPAEQTRLLAFYTVVTEFPRRATDILVAKNERLVTSIALKYLDKGLDLSDLRQEGVIGLLQAIEKYDGSRGTRLSTCATYWIRQRISRAVQEKGSIIRKPSHIHEKMSVIAKASETLQNLHLREPTPREIADEINRSGESIKMTAKTVIFVQRSLSLTPESLDVPPYDGSRDTLHDFLGDESADDPAEKANTFLLRRKIEQVLGELPPLEAATLRLRSGYNGKALTIQEVAAFFGCSREWIRQVEMRAIELFRKISKEGGFFPDYPISDKAPKKTPFLRGNSAFKYDMLEE